VNKQPQPSAAFSLAADRSAHVPPRSRGRLAPPPRRPLATLQRRIPQQQRPVLRPRHKVAHHVIAQLRLVSRPPPNSLVIAHQIRRRIKIMFLQHRPSLPIRSRRLIPMKSMRREVINAPDRRPPFDRLQFFRSVLPCENGFDIPRSAALHLCRDVCCLHQPERHMPVPAAQDASVQQPARRLERVASPAPRSPGRVRRKSERESPRRRCTQRFGLNIRILFPAGRQASRAAVNKLLRVLIILGK